MQAFLRLPKIHCSRNCGGEILELQQQGLVFDVCRNGRPRRLIFRIHRSPRLMIPL